MVPLSCVREVKIDGNVSNLRSAKHRFESFIKPLARVVLYVEAFTHTALRIIAERGREAAAMDARNFLLTITDEKLVQAALMADAADEAGQLIRECEGDGWDTAQMLQIVEHFKARVSFLFDDGGVLRTQSFTCYMLQYLSLSHTWVVDNQQYSVGSRQGVPPHIIAQCVDRMKAWKQVAFSIVESEFPNFQIYSSFCVFNLPDKSSSKVDMNDAVLDESFRRLARTFSVDVAALKREHEDHVHLAARLKVTQHLNNAEAWSQALTH